MSFKLKLATTTAATLLMSMAATAETITIVMPEQPSAFEPCRSIRNDIGRVVNMNITETLTVLDADTGKVEPYLATEWVQIDPSTWHFKLRKDVKFQDGAAFNAEAVAKSINRLMNPKLTCDSRSKFGDQKLIPKVIDEHTIEVASSIPNPIMPTLLSTVQIVSPNMPFDQESNKPVGTGPYVLGEVTGERVVLDRAPQYWGDKPEVSRAIIVWRPESAIRAAMVSSGEADMTPNIAVQDATNNKTDIAYLNSETTRMRIDMEYPPLNDKRVREALNIAVDWDGMGEALFGTDVLRATQMVVPGTVGHNATITPRKFDPDRAKKLVAEAKADGVPVDRQITLIGRNGAFPNSSESLEALRAFWADIGLNVTIRNLEAADWVRYLDKPFPGDRGPTVFQQQHDNNTGDAGFTIPVSYLSNGQYSTVADPKLDEVILKAQTASGAERDKGFQEAARMVHDDIVGDVTMYHMVGYVRVGPKLDWKPDIRTNGEIKLSDIKIRK